MKIVTTRTQEFVAVPSKQECIGCALYYDAPKNFCEYQCTCIDAVYKSIEPCTTVTEVLDDKEIVYEVSI